MKLHRLVSVALVCGLAAPLHAINVFDYSVTPAPGNAYDITPLLASSDSDYWCAAADHALNELNASGSTRVYALAGASGRAERFSLTPPATGPVQSIGLSLDLPGNNLSAAAAFQYCYNVDIKE